MSWGINSTAGVALTPMNSQGTSRLIYGRTYTALANDRATQLRVYVSTISAAQIAKIAIYDITVSRAAGTLVSSYDVPLGASGYVGWKTLDINQPLIEGNTYAYAFVGGAQSASWQLGRLTTSNVVETHSVANTYTFPTTWGTGGTTSTFDPLIEIVTAVTVTGTPIDFTGLGRNAVSPFYDYLYPTGNRP